MTSATAGESRREPLLIDEDKLEDAKRRFAEAERERQKIYEALARLEARRQSRSPASRLRRFLGLI